MVNYRTQIKKVASSFELSCIWEDVRNAYWNKKTISQKMYNKSASEIVSKRKQLNNQF